MDAAIAEARAAVDVWINVAIVNPHQESKQIAKSFAILMKCQIELQHNNEATATFEQVLRSLRKPLQTNPTPVLSEISNMMQRATVLDPSIIHRIPSEVRELVSNLRHLKGM